MDEPQRKDDQGDEVSKYIFLVALAVMIIIAVLTGYAGYIVYEEFIASPADAP